MHCAPPFFSLLPLFSYALAVSDTDDCVSGILYFDLDQYIDPNGLCVPAEITQVRRRRNSVGVALDTCCEVKNAISSNGACRCACIRYYIKVRVACHSRLQYCCGQAPIRVNG